MNLSHIHIGDSAALFLAWLRILAMVLTLPKLNPDRYHLIFRILFATVLSLVVAPLFTGSKDLTLEVQPHLLLTLSMGEIGIGLCLGLAASCAVIGLLAAGQMVSQLLGFQIGSLQQGLSAEQTSDYRKLFFSIGLFSWFAVSGHRFAVQGLMVSFAEFPVGEAHFSLTQIELVNQLVQVCLVFAIRFSLPVLVVAILGFMIAGFFHRIIGTGQSTGVAFGLNQILFFAIAIPLVLVYSEETYVHASGQIENAISFLTGK